MNDDLTADGLYKDDAGKMTTFTGRSFNPLTMGADDVDILDIAHSLSRQCRYNGHVGGYLSVARHSVWVADRLSALRFGPRIVMAGLLHDAAEAYLGDMIRPLKYGPSGVAYLRAEHYVEECIAFRYGLPFPWPPAVRTADNYVLMERELPRPDGARFTWESTPDQDVNEFLACYDLTGRKL